MCQQKRAAFAVCVTQRRRKISPLMNKLQRARYTRFVRTKAWSLPNASSLRRAVEGSPQSR
jgi:hypothetical protein